MFWNLVVSRIFHFQKKKSKTFQMAATVADGLLALADVATTLTREQKKEARRQEREKQARLQIEKKRRKEELRERRQEVKRRKLTHQCNMESIYSSALYAPLPPQKLPPISTAQTFVQMSDPNNASDWRSGIVMCTCDGCMFLLRKNYAPINSLVNF
jgi:hypothetical protein